ncbi:hypothetical protein ABW21_db0203450 [Orbilia brochopaga]|nr:hypothetical protein ABW21_db0203450 [Drechslerella brochopaga]
MRTLRGLVAAATLICSVKGTPNDTKRTGPITDFVSNSSPGDQQTSNTGVSSAIEGSVALARPVESNTLQSSLLPSNDRTVTPGSTNREPIPIDYGDIQSVAVKVAIASTTTAVAISVATVAATATETVGLDEDSVEDAGTLATAAVGSNEAILIDLNSTDATASGSANMSNSATTIIIGQNGTKVFNTLEATESPIFGPFKLDASDENNSGRGSLRNSSTVVTNDKFRKRQEITEQMPDIDSISFQTHTSEGFNQPRIVPVFEAVVDTTTTSSSTTTTSSSTILTTGTSTTITTSTSSASTTTTSTSTSYTDSSTVTTQSGVAVVTEWTTASTTTCTPAESHTSYTAPLPLQTMCSDTTTLCTVTVAYVISMDPTTTSYYTTPFDTTAIAGAAATQTVYSEDPNGFHVYITTQDNSNGAATATFYFTTPTPTAALQQVSSSAARKFTKQSSIITGGLAMFWSSVLYSLV